MLRNLKSGSDSELSSNQSRAHLFFSNIIKSYGKAVSNKGEFRRFFKIGGTLICLSFAGRTGIPLLTPAFEHLTAADCENAELEISVWDSVSTSVNLPPVPWNVRECLSRNQPWRFRNKRFDILFQPENSILNIMDYRLRTASFWIRNFQNLPQYEIGSPLLAILHWWFIRRNLQLIHAAAVGRPEGGVLIVGKGGAGKSSAALSCLRSDLLYAGDDYCLVSNKSVPRVHSIYSTGKLNAGDEHLFPYLEFSKSRCPCTEKQEKSIYFLNRSFPERLLDQFPLKAVLIPKLSGLPFPRIDKIPPAQGLLALGPSTVFQLPGFEERAFRNLGEVIKKVPCYSLELSPDMEKNAHFLSQFLNRA